MSVPQLEPMTPEGWKVAGCAAALISSGLVGVGVYFCIKTGFKNRDALGVLGGGVALAATVAVIWCLVRCWAERL
jgi:hypothetical protein